MKDSKSDNNNPLMRLQTYVICGSIVDVVDACELHSFLQQDAPYGDWIVEKISHYDLEKNVDYFLITSEQEGAAADEEPTYLIVLGTAKELASTERNGAGRRARRYLIEREKELISDTLQSKSDAAQESQEFEKYQQLNRQISAMKLKSAPIIIPLMDAVDMLRAIRMYQNQIAQFRTPDWVNESLEKVKRYSNRTLADN